MVHRQIHSSTQHGFYLQPLYAYILLGDSHPLHHTLGVVNDIINEGRERNATTRVLPAAPGQRGVERVRLVEVDSTAL